MAGPREWLLLPREPSTWSDTPARGCPQEPPLKNRRKVRVLCGRIVAAHLGQVDINLHIVAGEDAHLAVHLQMGHAGMGGGEETSRGGEGPLL